MMSGPCLFDWYAPRHDVTDSVNVRHMCEIGEGHAPSSYHRCVCGGEAYVTMTGKVLTDADIEALADEAQRGYDVSRLRARRT